MTKLNKFLSTLSFFAPAVAIAKIEQEELPKNNTSHVQSTEQKTPLLKKDRHVTKFIETSDLQGVKAYLQDGYELEAQEVQDILKTNPGWLTDIKDFGPQLKEHILAKQQDYLIEFVQNNMRWNNNTIAPHANSAEDYENLKNMRFFDTFQKEKIEHNALIKNIFQIFPEAFQSPDNSNLFQQYRENMEDTIGFLQYVRDRASKKYHEEMDPPPKVSKTWIDSSIGLKDAVVKHAETLPEPTIKREVPEEINASILKNPLIGPKIEFLREKSKEAAPTNIAPRQKFR